MKRLTINIVTGPFLVIPPVKGGGVEVYAYGIAKELSRKHRVRIYAPISENIPLNTGIEFINLKSFKKSNIKIFRIIQELIYGFLVNINLRKADITHFFDIKSFIACFFNSKKKGKTFLHLQIIFGGISSRFIKYANKIIANSEFTKRHFIKNDNHLHFKIESIPNAVNLDKFYMKKSSLKEKYTFGNRKVIGFIGRVSSEKGIEYLIDAFKLLIEKEKNVFLLIVGPYKDEEFGDFRYFKRLKRRITNYGLEKDIVFTGLIPHEKLPEYYNICDIVCFPHIGEEAFGIVAIEALACGKPVIITDCGALTEIITNGINGFVIQEKDTRQLAYCLSRLIKDENLRNSISRKARIRAEDFSFTKICQRYEVLYKTL